LKKRFPSNVFDINQTTIGNAVTSKDGIAQIPYTIR
jgi:hypothetical protein